MKKIIYALSFSFLIVSLVGCDKESKIDNKKAKVEVSFTKGEIEKMSNLNDFSFELFNEFAPTKGSTMISPLSIQVGLSMNTNLEFLNGENRKYFIDKMSCKSVQELNSLMNKILQSQSENESSKGLHLSNLIIPNLDMDLFTDKEAEKVVKEKYFSDIHPMSFSKPEKVNKKLFDWVFDKSNKMLELPKVKIPKDAFYVWANVLYFKGLWKFPFDKANNKDGLFTTSLGEKQKEVMMERVANVLYYEKNDARAISLPYDDNYAMAVVVTPDNKIDYSLWKNILADFDLYNVEFSIPKFTQEFVFNPLSLKSYGVSGESLHMTKIIVDETGVEASGATTGTIISPSPDKPEIKKFKADKTFYYVVYDTTTNLILFIGRFDG